MGILDLGLLKFLGQLGNARESKLKHKEFELGRRNYRVPTIQTQKMKISVPNRILAACTVGTVGLGSKVRGSLKSARRIVV